MRDLDQRLVLAASLVAAGVLAGGDLFGTHLVDRGGAGLAVIGIVVVLAVLLGGGWSWRRSLLGLVPLVVALTAGSATFNPFLAFLPVGGWACGVVVASQRRLARQLEIRARELHDEQELVAAQSVYYERAQIARELHDVVAHCVSLIVVQANAGTYLVATRPAAAAQTFDAIREIARQARAEVDRLSTVLDARHLASTVDAADLLETVVAGAVDAGLTVDCALSGELTAVPAASAETLRRVVQESLTNVVKHAPGALVRVVVHASAETVEVEVVSSRGRAAGQGLAGSGSGRGLLGMRDRVLSAGGTFRAGASGDGGWRVAAVLPRDARSVLTGEVA